MNVAPVITDVTFTHWHGFCGAGGGAKGFNKGSARVGNLRARFRCLGGVDVDPAGIRDFNRFAGVPGTVLDMFDLEQYRAFNGRDPEPGWRQATPEDIRRSAGYEFPDIVFMSAPCKGFSGLLPEQSSATAKYQALNRLTLRGVWLMLEAFKDSLPSLIIFENVPRIMTRGRKLLDQIVALLRSYGYAVAETTHDCGEIGGLGQSRKRFLLVARHEAKVPPFLYEPEKKRLRGVGEILEKLPLPGDPRGGPMHRVPSLQWKTWVRLAFVEAGGDWRSLNKLAVEDGVLRDFAIMPAANWRDGSHGVLPWDGPSGVVTAQAEATTGRFSVADPREFGAPHNGAFGVKGWQDPAGAVTSNGRPAAGAFSVADPRPPEGSPEYSQYGVRPWDEPSGAVINVKSPGQGVFSVADPRVDGHEKSVQLGVRRWDQTAACVKGDVSVGTGPYAVSDPRMEGRPRFNNVFRIVRWGETSPAVAGPGGPANGLAVADPRTGYKDSAHQNILSVADWEARSKAITGAKHVAGGALSVADPRPVGLNANREHYKTGGHYGVLAWEQNSGAVPAYGKYDRGPWSVADPRGGEGDIADRLPAPADRLVAVIRALDGTWHRPFTTLELGALQSYFDPDEVNADLVLDGQSDSAWRERIGNMVPPDAAEAMAGVMGTTLLLAMTGHTFVLSSQPIWVRPIAMALAVDQRGNIPAEVAE